MMKMVIRLRQLENEKSIFGIDMVKFRGEKVAMVKISSYMMGSRMTLVSGKTHQYCTQVFYIGGSSSGYRFVRKYSNPHFLFANDCRTHSK